MSNPIPESELIINPDGSIYHLKLKPGQVADIVITVGDPNRVGKISARFDSIELEVEHREFVTHTGWLHGKRISVISTGMGTDNVEIFMTELDALFNVDFNTRKPNSNHKRLNIIRIGTSGSMQSSLPEGSLLASAMAVGLDTLMAFYAIPQTTLESQMAYHVQKCLALPFLPYCVTGSQKLLAIIGKGVSSGITVTCPGFFGPQGREVRLKPRISSIFSLLGEHPFQEHSFTNFEMETAGYYAMGSMLGHDVLSMNAIVANRISGNFASAPELIIDQLIDSVLEKISAIS
ncbi:nucleoside phosphorylase [uncultured Cyclobacterium sp.]|uniref:nucleoside phosphorylase n=1 Tax=uncultured Cyclobacterium sp. TaxID=453820 RepID=UPI0030EB5530|tara:strand:- start:102466 stop:103338 length:873 start_codon:yes stop_codon:yes gene_type:complete